MPVEPCELLSEATTRAYAHARPGDVVVLTDSHTPTAGVLNAFAFGVGSTAMAFALRTGLIPVTVPKVVRVVVSGALLMQTRNSMPFH